MTKGDNHKCLALGQLGRWVACDKFSINLMAGDWGNEAKKEWLLSIFAQERNTSSEKQIWVRHKQKSCRVMTFSIVVSAMLVNILLKGSRAPLSEISK